MLRIVTGPAYPVLERALIDEVRRSKPAGPLAPPIALIVPSTHLVTALRQRLTVGAGLSLLNVHFLTFYQLALRLTEERQAVEDAAPSVAVPEVVSDFFCERLIAHVLGQGLPGLQGLTRHPSPGAAAALWATIRDLKDAAVEPAAALRALAEGLFPTDDGLFLESVFTLQAAVLEAGRVLAVGTADDLTAQALPWVERSPWLGRFERAIYYGFYDLTQVQLAFFDSVTARVPATVYFPDADGPAFQFSRRFLERHLTKGTVVIEPAQPTPDGGPRREPVLSLANAAGVEDELSTVCKSILDLLETRGYAPGEIGVVARSLGPYQASLRRIFDQHRIAFSTTAGQPVMQAPLAKTLLQLARLADSGFDHRLLLDVVTSPWYGLAPEEATAARPELWRRLVADLGILKGEAEWNRLARVQDDGSQGEAAAAQAALLLRLVQRLIRDCRALPPRGGMAALTDAFTGLAERHLLLPAEDGSGAPRPDQDPARVMNVVRQAWAQLRQLDKLGAEATWEEWVAAFTETLDRAVFPIAGDGHAGVQVLEAMAARGLTFRALFLIGMNEKAFPRVVREDAFLRDRHRRVLAETLGYKIDEKLAGYDEEQLLFTLLCRSAGERLFLSYQRADESGRPLAPSPYLEQVHGAETLAVPRRSAERVGRAPFLPLLLTPREWALHQIASGRDVTALLAAGGGEAEIFRNALSALQGIEGEEAGAYDGLTGPLEGYWAAASARGLAPTPLEQYASCPFQYFADQVLRLKPARPETTVEPGPLVLGELAHATLRLAYGRLLDLGWPEREGAAARTGEVVQRAAAETFAAQAEQSGGGYPLLWGLAKESLVGLLTTLVEEDRRDCLESGFRPAGFEVEAEGSLELLDAADFKDVQVVGRLDRVDRRVDSSAWRIVDYKFKQGREMTGVDRDLLTAAVRGSRLQPPLYAAMRPRAAEDLTGRSAGGAAGSLAGLAPSGPEQVELLFLAPAWDRTVVRSTFEASAWRGPAGPALKRTVARLLAGIRGGQYMILPADRYCDFCEFSTACRRFHGPTERRAYRAAPARELRLLRKQKVERG